MPLKFLKKCRQYNVTSKNSFVIFVHHLLDTSTTVDCTISAESLGQECLDNVCQRLLIQQPEFFGLRYLVKGKEDEYKWIDLERSLSRQLEKYAAGTKIFLRVRHYVTTGVRHLNDEVTRYYYFLQLKSDIYEGKITCDIRTAILLALYCRQAEYDSYQSEKQTKDYLKKSLLLPRNLQGLANDDNILDSLIVEVLQQNAGIAHLTQNPAEEMYIQCCQQLEGYGEERFQAKDTLGNDILLGLAINGMIVTSDNGRQYFPWKDFHTVTIDKRTIKIEQNKVDGDGSIVGSFIFNEADTARYFWKLCITQHKFFKRYIDTDVPSVGSGADVESANGVQIGDSGGGSSYAYDYNDASRENLMLEQQQRAIYASGDITIVGSGGGSIVASQREDFMSAPTLQQQLPHGLMASTNSSSALMSSNISLAASHQSGNGGLHATHPAAGQSWANKDYSHDYVSNSQLLSNSMLDTRLGQSSSCLDLSNNNLHSSTTMLGSGNHNNNNNHILTADAHERERLKAMLPTYRPAPDYETAVQLKYRTPSSELHNHASNLHYQTVTAAASHTAAYYAGSQPDVHNPSAYDGVLLSHLAAHHYPDVAQPAAAMHAHHHMSAAAAAAAAMQHQQHQQQQQHTTAYMDLTQRVLMMRNKPPPPYPVNRLSSSSTPDLAVATHRPLLGYRAYVSGSSPDLVSNRNLIHNQYPYGIGNGHVSGVGVGIGSSGIGAIGGGGNTLQTSSGATMLHQYPYIGHMGHSQTYLPPHGTFENLNMIEEQPSIMSQLRQSAMSQATAVQTVNPSYEQHSPTLPPSGYRGSSNSQQLPAAAQQQQSQTSQATTQQHQTQPAPLQRSAMNGSIEPIYENVPLPQYANTLSTTTPLRNCEQRVSGASIHNGQTGNNNNNTNDSMRTRAPSIQSAPGVMPVPAARHHHQQPHSPPPPPSSQLHSETNDVSTLQSLKKYGNKTNPDRAASSELQFLEPTPPLRAIRAASAAPAIGSIVAPLPPAPTQTPPPRQRRSNLKKTAASASVSAVDVISPSSTSTLINTRHASASHDDSLHQQFTGMNISSSASSSMYNSTLDTTTTTLNSTNTTTYSKDVKRKKRWNILGRSKTPDKQKSATLGREKVSSTSAKMATKMRLAQDDLNLPHRWSTGVPKLQPISAQYSKDKLCQILNDKLNDTQLFMEFESIPKRRDYASYDCALIEENANKNFDPNFLPYDDNRVRITPTMDNRHGYVNASHISSTVGTKQRFYIVAQSPHEELTTRIFWQCVWEADVYLIVQLSEDMNYIPPNSNQRMEFGQFQVYQEFSQTTDRCTTSKLRLYHITSRRYRSVWHLHYSDWAEQNCPRDVNHFLDFLEELNSVRLASTDEVPPGHNTNPPVLIHCLEGGGRSGVTLTADLLLYTLDHNEDLDIPRVIGQLRHQRDSIIPSLAQYKFIHSLLITYLKRTRLI